MFPINLSSYKPLKLNLKKDKLTVQQKKQLSSNVQLVRDAIVFFTAVAGRKGLSGHTGGAYDIVPEVLLADGFMKGKNGVVPVLYDAAGHRVAIQYVMAVLNGYMKVDKLLHYREHKSGLWGHPERDEKNGIFFSSGRLGHLWSYVNGICEQNPSKKVVLFTSDGSLEEGNDSEAARYCVAHNLNLTLCVDDNNVTIEGHPHRYLPGYNVESTLHGHGLNVSHVNGDDLDKLYASMRKSFLGGSPTAIVVKRTMARGIPDVEGEPKGHDVVPYESAVKYLRLRKHDKAVKYLEKIKNVNHDYQPLGSSSEWHKNRSVFGDALVSVLDKLPSSSRKKNLVVSCDLGGSTGVDKVHKKYSSLYRMAGVMERNNFSVAAGFGSRKGFQGIYSTFSVFSEMVISEIGMARLNDANVLVHYSHAGVDDMADNTCHFGVNVFFVDNGFWSGDDTRLYFPADANQMKAVVKKVFKDSGLRFVFSTRSKTPLILDNKGKEFYGSSYNFVPGRDEVIREGSEGYIVSYGDCLYRSLDAVEKLRKKGRRVGLVNKVSLNVIDEKMMKKLSKAKFVLVVESQNEKTGLGVRFGTWLLERGFKGKYKHVGVHKLGLGGLCEQIPFQGLDSKSIEKEIK
jgi:transketolase